MTSHDPSADFTMTRTFNAPRALVFAAMTQTEHLARWWGPQGCAITVLKHDPQPGGVFHYRMGFGPGVEMYGRFDYREVKPVERIVFVNGFADEAGNRIRYAMSPTWPLEMLITTTLDEEGGQTVMTMRSTPLNASDVEIETFKAGHDSMQQGFGGMYEEFEKYLATMRGTA